MTHGPQMNDSQLTPGDTVRNWPAVGAFFSFDTFLSTEHLKNKISQALHSNQWNHKGYSFDSQTHSLSLQPLPLNNSDKRECLLKANLHFEIVPKSSIALRLQSNMELSTGSKNKRVAQTVGSRRATSPKPQAPDTGACGQGALSAVPAPTPPGGAEVRTPLHSRATSGGSPL